MDREQVSILSLPIPRYLYVGPVLACSVVLKLVLGRTRTRYVALLLGFLTVLVGSGCSEPVVPPPKDPTLQEAVADLRKYGQHIVESLRAKNPSAADKELHESMYLADHLDEFASKIEVDKVALESDSRRLLKLLLKAHTGAHGGSGEWDQNAVADEMTAILERLEEVSTKAVQ